MMKVYELNNSFLGDDVRYELNVFNWLVVMKVNEIR